MAISRLQPLRPAVQVILDVIDNVSDTLIPALRRDLTAETSARTSGDTALQQQIGTGFTAENTIASNIAAARVNFTRISEDLQDINDKIGLGFTSENNISLNIANLADWQNRFKFGTTIRHTIQGGSTIGSLMPYSSPFPQDAQIAVFLTIVDGPDPFTDVTIDLLTSANDEFGYRMVNNTADPKTVQLGYLAVRLN